MLKTAAWRREPWQDLELGRRFQITAGLKMNAGLLKGKFFKMPLLTRLSHSLPDKSSLF